MKILNITFQSLCCAKHVYQYKSLKSLYSVLRNGEVPEPELDIDYLCNDKYKSEIEENIKRRKGIGNIDRVHELHNKLRNGALSEENSVDVIKEFKEELKLIPNKTCPLVAVYGDNPKVVKAIGNKRKFDFQPKEFTEITKMLHLVRTDNLSNLSGHKSYYLMGDLAEMEQALVWFTIKKLLERKFQLISVPDILPAHIIENCGMTTKGDRTQVYMLDDKLYKGDHCLSGTAEMSLAGYLMNRELRVTELPLRLAAVSRCYRAETSRMAEERGIYRVHQFTKVEMFLVTECNSSAAMLEELRELQEQMFASLGLHVQTIDMPPHELGAPAYRKYDIEAWMPGRQMFGEVSSCSDCTDYQSRRLNIKYRQRETGSLLHAHTLNGTACAVPRMLIALLETHQHADGTVAIPEPLQPYMKDKVTVNRQDFPEMKFVKSKYADPKCKND
ncbi:hypothetical protein Cfor_10109 [Coptotermes formosanus]|uniref:serine--tRNA ligase n=1 Tax=Coptotermes formosanus TaxID=36987 RepID=A0A6L2PY12_COPFO|nr:hypothetical protein Cfor_10109 [Coptotermes formosanus]